MKQTFFITMLIMMHLASFGKQESHNPDKKTAVIAIPASKKSADALIAESFSRCSFFCLYEPETGKVSFIENPYKNASGGASRQVIQFLSNNNVKEVYAVKAGDNAQRHLNRSGMTLKTVKSGQTVQEVINSIKKQHKVMD